MLSVCVGCTSAYVYPRFSLVGQVQVLEQRSMHQIKAHRPLQNRKAAPQTAHTAVSLKAQ
jgi:hypothetical protein